MTLFQNKYRIESTRRPGWDYSSNGYYFVTVCTKNRNNYFGEIVDGEMRLSEIGLVADNYWNEISKHFKFVKLDEYIIMPNHLHGILEILDTLQCNVSTNVSTDVSNVKNPVMAAISPKRGSLASVIRSYKSACTKTINERFPEIDLGLQHLYHDSIIRNDESLQRIRQYIINNPNKLNDDDNKT